MDLLAQMVLHHLFQSITVCISISGLAKMFIFQVALEVESGSEDSEAVHALKPQAQMFGFNVPNDIIIGSTTVTTSTAQRLNR